MAIVNLGDTVKHRISGFEGVAVAKTEWLNGCVRFIVQAIKLNNDGKPSVESFDAPELTVTDAGTLADCRPATAAAPPGGPYPTPSRHAGG